MRKLIRKYQEGGGKKYEELQEKRKILLDSAARLKGYGNHDEYVKATDAELNEPSTNRDLEIARLFTKSMNHSVEEMEGLGNAMVLTAKEKEQETKDKWKPLLLTSDMFLSILAALTGDPYIAGANMVTNGLQIANDVATELPVGLDAVSVILDAIGLLGSRGKLPNIHAKLPRRPYRLHYAPFRFTINTNKTADYAGRGWNIVDYLQDLHDMVEYNKAKPITVPFK